MDRNELINKIIEKKEYSQLPSKDVGRIFRSFDRDDLSDEEKIKKTRNELRKVYSVFTSGKLLNLKNREPEWFLKKHISTRERFQYYSEIYGKLLRGLEKEKLVVLDLGAGVNGLSFNYLKEINENIEYIGVEAMGQLVDLMNYYFKTRKIEEAKALHMSLFELDKILKIFHKTKEKKIVFLFKALDSLEMVERNYSKKLLKEIGKVSDRIVVSFATKSIGSRKNFHASRKWLVNFIEENFNVIENFEISGERYIVFCAG